MKNKLNNKYEGINLYGTCAYALLEDQSSNEHKVSISLEVTEELLEQLDSVGVKYTEN